MMDLLTGPVGYENLLMSVFLRVQAINYIHMQYICLEMLCDNWASLWEENVACWETDMMSAFASSVTSSSPF